MKTFNVTDGSKEFKLNLPTKLSEITEDYLREMTRHIAIAPYHAVIANVYRAKLIALVNAKRKSRDFSIGIVPIFVKAHLGDSVEKETEALFNYIDTCDKLIIGITDIERGYNITSTRNMLNMDIILSIYNNDKNFAKEILQDNNYYYFVDFKLVPISDIKGCYKNVTNDSYKNPFIEDISENTQAEN